MYFFFFFGKAEIWLIDPEPQKSESPHIPVSSHDASHGNCTNNPNEFVLEYGARELLSYHQVHVILQWNKGGESGRFWNGTAK
jgi:hypothetical protein